jgi:hypothetical protein
MGHGNSTVSVRLAIQTLDEISAYLLGAIQVMTAFPPLMLLAKKLMHFSST